MERYELLKDIGSGNFGVARLMRNKETKELVAMKYIPRGLKVCAAGFGPQKSGFGCLGSRGISGLSGSISVPAD